MGSVSKQHNFVWDTDANPDHVNENFDDIYAFVNTQVVHRDGSISFSAVPTGPALDPTTDNQLSRKKYVDDKAAAATTALNAAALARPTLLNYSGTLNGTAPALATTQFSIQAGTVVFTNSTSVTFPTAFPNGLVSVVVTCNDNTQADMLKTSSETKTGFGVQAWKLSSGSWDPSVGAVRISYIAIGY